MKNKNYSFQGDFIRLKIHHVLFWIVYATVWALLFSNSAEFSDSLRNALIVIFYHLLVSYFNIYFLLPKFLQPRKYLLYVLSLFLCILLVCFPLAVSVFSFGVLSEESRESVWSVNFFILNGISITYTVAITTSLRLLMQWYQKENQTMKLEKLNMETELKYLKSQINPHFLFNSLNNLYALTLKKSDQAPEMVLKLSEILRYSLYFDGEQQVSLVNELNYIRNFLEFEKLRLGDRVRVDLNIIGNPEGFYLEPMLFLPFVENSFKHGIDKNMKPGWIKVDFENSDKEVFFRIENSKPEQTSKEENYRGGIGIENVRKRLTLLYPRKHSLEIFDGISSFKVEMRIIVK